ncbi:MAG: D-2-hydroxyacid dehydrogenase [Fimbriimonas sp.]|nr:D-2-hydroxyacid dehydrogenase [Fimbriimonas sp.]
MPTVWTNVVLSASEEAWLCEKIAPYDLVIDASGVNNLTAGAGDPRAQEAEILFGQPAVEDLLNSTTKKWMHITSAGYTRYDTAEILGHLKETKTAFTNSSSVYDSPCAEHALAFILAHNRRLAPSLNAKTWTYTELRPQTRILEGQTVLIVGYGAIGERLAELLQPFRCTVRGLRREPRGNERTPCYRISELKEQLGWADHVVNILPLNASTELIFGEKEFNAMKPGATFTNIGRGDTVDQTALLNALNKDLAAALLDVVSPEPLPEGHPLWTAPNCWITPHIAGGLQNEAQTLLDHFVENFRLFQAKEKLVDRIV